MHILHRFARTRRSSPESYNEKKKEELAFDGKARVGHPQHAKIFLKRKIQLQKECWQRSSSTAMKYKTTITMIIVNMKGYLSRNVK